MKRQEFNIFICSNDIYLVKDFKYINSKHLKNCEWLRFIETESGIRMVEYVKCSKGLNYKITKAIIEWCYEKLDIITIVNTLKKCLFER